MATLIAGYVVLVVLLGFLLHPLHHLDPAWFAIMGATLLCIVTSRLDVEEVMHVSRLLLLLEMAQWHIHAGPQCRLHQHSQNNVTVQWLCSVHMSWQQQFAAHAPAVRCCSADGVIKLIVSV